MNLRDVIKDLRGIYAEYGDLPVFISQMDGEGEEATTLVKMIDTPVIGLDKAPGAVRLCDYID